jgi:membrane-associated phospholipid phosphatase
MSRLDATELRALRRLQRLSGRPGLTAAANVLSSAGEHAWLWMALAGTGATVDRRRRRQWVQVGAAAVVAHGGAVVLKRVVRRQRPSGTDLRILDSTASRLSFPSAHAASTTAAAVAATPLVGAAVTVPVVVAMATARMLLGVHYPTDVSAGMLIGLASAKAVARTMGRRDR